MFSLSDFSVLKTWEVAQFQNPVDRALTILAIASPCLARDSLAALTLGQRDALLLHILEQTFGPKLSGFAECPRCSEPLGFAVSTADIRVFQKPDSDKNETPLELVAGDRKIFFRLPDSHDLAAASVCEDGQPARSLLVQRCVIEASCMGKPLGSHELPAEAIPKLSTYIAECEPLAEVLVDLQCPDCGHHWQIIFDIADFLWEEISARAKRLIHEIHTLALAYGWRESDILAMGPIRRQSYLEMVS